MKVVSVKQKTSSAPVIAVDCFVDKGYLQGSGGSLPDVDLDFQSDRRQEIKEYTEQRYNRNGKQRVFSAGTTTTLKVKAVLKDVARTMRIPPQLVNYLTAIFEDDKCDYTGIFKLAAENKKIAKFITDYPGLFEDIRTLMFQPRSASIHASAVLITPDKKDGEELECFDFVPIKSVDGILVSENDGVELDELGLLKNDCLATKELSKLKAVMNICNRKYGTTLSLESIATGELNDPRVYKLLSQGHTQNVFQFGSRGMTKFLAEMKPTCINDLITANALYRPATLENGSVKAYTDCKLTKAAPVYLWGAYNALKDTYGLIVYQEQVALIAREIGNFSLGDGVKLVKYISKKQVDKIQTMKSKFLSGANKNGCPKEDAETIWEQIEACGSYIFNKCISGKETIYRLNGGKWASTIEEMYKIRNDKKWADNNGHKALYKKYNHKGYGVGWSLVDGGDYLLKNKIKDIRYMGIRPLYRITLENGATIDVTDNHKHPTEDGIKRTDELKAGVDRMYVNIGRKKQGEKGLYTELKTVVSVEYIGDDNVYDVEMYEPYHTFTTAKGVITCNSHATAYAVTSYVGAYLKANYPTAFYTVALQWADDDELVTLMGEMEACSQAKVAPPDINMSGDTFYTDYQTHSIFWSISRIKQLGTKAVQWIVDERNKNGEFSSITNFIDRIFKYKLKNYKYWDDPDNEEEVKRCPVNARHVLNLILAGCFDNIEQAGSVVERYAIIEKAAGHLGFEIKEKDFPVEMRDKHYFWSQQQVKVSGTGSIDYKRIYDNSDAKPSIAGKASYATLRNIAPPDPLDSSKMEDKKVAVCATVVEVEERKFKSKKTGKTEIFCKIMLQQNNDLCECVVWPEEYAVHRGKLLNAKNKLIIFSATVKYSDYAGKNNLQFYRNSVLEVL